MGTASCAVSNRESQYLRTGRDCAGKCKSSEHARIYVSEQTYLNDTLAKLFEGLLLDRVATHTESNNTLTSNQLGTKSYTQTHDAIYSLISTIQYNKHLLQKPTYVTFC